MSKKKKDYEDDDLEWLVSRFLLNLLDEGISSPFTSLLNKKERGTAIKKRNEVADLFGLPKRGNF